MAKLGKLHHITLIESGATRCAWLRIGNNGEYYKQSFAYTKYGGKRKAIQAAKVKRDEIGPKFYGEAWPYTRDAPRSTFASNTSGTVGVTYREKGQLWMVNWQEGPRGKRKQCRAYYRISEFGKRKAKQLAIQRRKVEISTNALN